MVSSAKFYKTFTETLYALLQFLYLINIIMICF